MRSILNNQTLKFLTHMPEIFWSLVMGLMTWFIPRSLYAKKCDQDIVLITGAGSGLGRAIALEYAKLSSSLVLWDINAEGLQETKDLINAEYRKKTYDDGVTERCLTYIVDVSDKQKISEAAKKVRLDLNQHNHDEATGRYVSVLVNNAGIYHALMLQDLTDDQIERVFKINILAHFWTVRAFLPDMIKHKKGHIVEIASMAGIGGLHKQVDYSATKFATVGFEEALSIELDHLGLGDQIHTTVVCPFFFDSNLFTDFNTKAGSLMTSEYVAKETVMSMRCNHSKILLPKFSGYRLFLFKPLLPRQTLRLLTRVAGFSECIKEIKGRAAAC